MNSATALEQLQSGNERYLTNKSQQEVSYSAQRAELLSGQAPFATILSCADSRVPPEIIFDAGLGEVFIIRVAGNIANTDSIASIEYAVKYLGCPLVVVMGHQSCGAVAAAISGDNFGKNLNHLVDHIKPAVEATKSSASDDMVPTIHVNAKNSASDLISKSEIIKEAVEKNETKIVSAYYNLDSGKVDFLE